jgi:FkbM family methyltransferase
MQFDYVPWWQGGTPAAQTIDIEGFSNEDLIVYCMRCQKTFWEVDLLEYVGMCAPKGGVYLDVGGNIGNHAVFFGKYKADRVISIEPHPKLVPILRRNLKANGIPTGQVLPFAAGSANGVGHIHVREGFEKNIGGSQIRENAGAAATESEVEIQIKTLDDIVDSIRPAIGGMPITFVKMDVEGMEIEALKGARKLLADQHPQLLIEIITDEALAEVESILKPLGYQQVMAIGNPPSYHFADPSRHQVPPTQWKGNDPYVHWRSVMGEQIAKLVPAGQTVIFVDLHQLSIGKELGGRKRLPFLEKDGEDWGAPADDATALKELERMRMNGAKQFGLAWPAYWWFEHYKEFTRYLREKCKTLHEDSRMTLFELP